VARCVPGGEEVDGRDEYIDEGGAVFGDEFAENRDAVHDDCVDTSELLDEHDSDDGDDFFTVFRRSDEF